MHHGGGRFCLFADEQMNSMKFMDQLRFNADGLIPAIVQEHSTQRVLMMAWMNQAALEKTMASGKTVFWSRSRRQFWCKGETSGHFQKVKNIALDCDGDTLLIQVEQTGAACHEGYHSCFFRSVGADGQSWQTTEERMADPGEVYKKK
jgi:phosphoribosyl-AMP cyclohydrolase